MIRHRRSRSSELYTKPEVNAIIIVPTDKQALIRPIKKATELGIKVVTIDSGLDGNYHLSFIGTNNIEGGVLAAKHLASRMSSRQCDGLAHGGRGHLPRQRAEGFCKR